MLNNLRKLAIPDSVLTSIRDKVVDGLAKHLTGNKRKLVLNFRSDAKFRNELHGALERAVRRFALEYQDQELVASLTHVTEFWSLPHVQEIVAEIALRPSSYHKVEIDSLHTTFAEVIPHVDSQRIDDAVWDFLRCVGEEVMNIPELAPIYEAQIGKISLQQGLEIIATLQESNQISRGIQQAIIALLENVSLQQKLLPEVIFPQQDDLEELKQRYFVALKEKYEYMDMGGISPRVTSKTESRVIKIRMDDVFIPLRAKGEEVEYISSQREALKVTVQHHPMMVEGGIDASIGEGAERFNTLTAQSPLTTKLKDSKIVGVDRMLVYPKTVVLGHPGAGKTTIGKYIAYAIACGNAKLIGQHLQPFIPVIIRAAEYGKLLKKEIDLSVYAYLTGKSFSNEYGPLFAWALKQKHCLVIIDGLDEVPEEDVRVRVANKIEQFVDDYWENRFLISSRIVGYQQNQLTGNFVHFTLVDLEKDQIILFLEKWYGVVGNAAAGRKTVVIEKEAKERAGKLWNELQMKEGVRRLAGTPLLLTIIALVSYYGKKLPERRIEFYDLATETLLSNWPLHREQKVDLDWRMLLSILEPVAYKIFTTSSDRLITEYEFQPLFDEQIQKVLGVPPKKIQKTRTHLLEQLELHTGYFLKRGTNEQGQDVYGFLHPTFAEYLTARYLANQWIAEHMLSRQKIPGQSFHLANYAHQATWHEVILLMSGHLGMMNDTLVTQFVEEIENLRTPYDEHLYRNLLLVAEIIGDKVIVSRDKRDHIISQLISVALETPHLPLWHTLVGRLKGIVSAFPIAERPEQLRPQRNDEPEKRIKKMLLSRAAGFPKENDLDVLMQGPWANLLIRQLADEALREYLDAARCTPTHVLVKIEFRSDIEFERNQSSLSFSKVCPYTVNRLDTPLVSIANLDMKTLSEIRIPSQEQPPQLWLLDLKSLSQLSVSELNTFIGGQAEWKLWLIFGILSYYTKPQEIRVKWVEDSIKQLTSVNKEERSFGCNFLLWITEEDFRQYVLFTGMRPSKNLWESISQVSAWRKILHSIIFSNEEAEFRIKVLKILIALTPNQEDRAAILLKTLKDEIKEMQVATANIACIYSISTPALIEKLRELFKKATPEVQCACAEFLIMTNNFQEEDILSLLEVVSKTSAEADQLEVLIRLAEKTNVPTVARRIRDKIKEIINQLISKIQDYSLPALTSVGTREKSLIDFTFNYENHSLESIISHGIVFLKDFDLMLETSDNIIRDSIFEYFESDSDQEMMDLVVTWLKSNKVFLKRTTIEALELSRHRLLEISEVIDSLLGALDEPRLEDVAIEALIEVQRSDIRQGIIERVLHRLNQNPGDSFAHGALSRLIEG